MLVNKLIIGLQLSEFLKNRNLKENKMVAIKLHSYECLAQLLFFLIFLKVFFIFKNIKFIFLSVFFGNFNILMYIILS